MVKNKDSWPPVLADVSNTKNRTDSCIAGQKDHAGVNDKDGGRNAAKPIVTFTRKGKGKKELEDKTSQTQESLTPLRPTEQDDSGSPASPALTDFSTPLVADNSTSFFSQQSAHTPWHSVASTKTGSTQQETQQSAPKGNRAYPRRVAQKGKDSTDLTAYMTQMCAYYAEVDDFELAVETPQPAAVQPRRDAQSLEDTPLAAAEGIAAGDVPTEPLQPDLNRTSRCPEDLPACPADLPGRPAAAAPDQDAAGDQPAATLPERDSTADMAVAAKGDSGSKAAEHTEDGPDVESIQIPLEPAAMASGRGSRSRRFSARPSLAHARKSLAAPQLRSSLQQPPNRRSSILEQLSSRFSLSNGLARVSLGISDALSRLGIGGLPSDGAPAQACQEGRIPRVGDNAAVPALAAAQAPALKPVRAFSPIAESPEASEPERATPEPPPAALAAGAVAGASTEPDQATSKGATMPPQQLGAMLESRLCLGGDSSAAEQDERAAEAAEEPTPMQQLLKLCGQEGDLGDLPGMEALLGRHVDLGAVRKIGEGTFGEAFRAGDVVLKIVPMEGDTPVNGEPQKRAAEILAEAAVALTLSQLHPDLGATSPPPQHETAGFVRTFGVGVCRGRYAESLVKEWRAWDAERGSENDPIDVFPADQLYIVFVVADGGADLEHFEVHGFEEARSILLQTVLALAVAEEAVEFEHRDLHWGNLLIRRVPKSQRTTCRLRGVEIGSGTSGVQVTLIDFTLSRLRTVEAATAFCDLAADPELFQGPRGDCQADTYRRMKKATGGDWAGFHPATNCLWLHYLADTLLQLKALPATADQKKALRGFRKRALGCGSCADLLLDDFLRGQWLAGGR